MKIQEFENEDNDDIPYNPLPGTVAEYNRGGILQYKNSLGTIYGSFPASNIVTVGASPEAHYATIGAAITASVAGTRIFVMRGTYNESLLINKRLEIIGEDFDTIIAGNVTFQAGSNNSRLTYIKVDNIITLNPGTKMIRVLDVLMSPVGDVIENSDSQSNIFIVMKED